MKEACFALEGAPFTAPPGGRNPPSSTAALLGDTPANIPVWLFLFIHPIGPELAFFTYSYRVSPETLDFAKMADRFPSLEEFSAGE